MKKSIVLFLVLLLLPVVAAQEVDSYRYEIEEELGEEWCVYQLENALRQRNEIEHALSEETLDWFFTSFVEENPHDWEQQMEAVFDMYWGIVDTTRELAYASECLDQDFPEINPIDISYESP